MSWYNTKDGDKEWALACFLIRNKTMASPGYTTYLEVHQRIEAYSSWRVRGMWHGDAMEKALNTPRSDLPHIVFEVADG